MTTLLYFVRNGNVNACLNLHKIAKLRNLELYIPQNRAENLIESIYTHQINGIPRSIAATKCFQAVGSHVSITTFSKLAIQLLEKNNLPGFHFLGYEIEKIGCNKAAWLVYFEYIIANLSKDTIGHLNTIWISMGRQCQAKFNTRNLLNKKENEFNFTQNPNIHQEILDFMRQTEMAYGGSRFVRNLQNPTIGYNQMTGFNSGSTRFGQSNDIGLPAGFAPNQHNYNPQSNTFDVGDKPNYGYSQNFNPAQNPSPPQNQYGSQSQIYDSASSGQQHNYTMGSQPHYAQNFQQQPTSDHHRYGNDQYQSNFNSNQQPDYQRNLYDQDFRQSQQFNSGFNQPNHNYATGDNQQQIYNYGNNEFQQQNYDPNNQRQGYGVDQNQSMRQNYESDQHSQPPTGYQNDDRNYQP